MKKIMFLVLCILMCGGLTSCAIYSSANMARIHSDSVTVLGPWGFVHTGANTDLDFFTGRQVASKDAIKENGKVDWPPVTNIQADSNSNLNIGKATKSLPTPKVVVPESTDASILNVAAQVIKK